MYGLGGAIARGEWEVTTTLWTVSGFLQQTVNMARHNLNFIVGIKILPLIFTLEADVGFAIVSLLFGPQISIDWGQQNTAHKPTNKP